MESDSLWNQLRYPPDSRESDSTYTSAVWNPTLWNQVGISAGLLIMVYQIALFKNFCTKFGCSRFRSNMLCSLLVVGLPFSFATYMHLGDNFVTPLIEQLFPALGDAYWFTHDDDTPMSKLDVIVVALCPLYQFFCLFLIALFFFKVADR